jgi:predicted RNA-binding protein YlxR (DUF448 family)
MLTTAADSELDRGPAVAGGERFCALSRAAKPVEEMIRFVVGPDNAVVPDVKRKLPGRGIWLSATRGSVDEAVKRRVFARGFRKEVRVPPDLAAMTERLLERAALDALAIAGKAGEVASGFGKVEDAIGSGEAVALIHASEAAEDGKRKLAAALRRNSNERREIAVIEAFSVQQLDLALGRVNVVHAALLGGAVSATLLARTRRFLSFRDGISIGASDVAANVEEQLRTE